jgi:probable rRNA maturation factor
MLEIRNLTDYKPDKKSFSQVAKIVLAGENREKEHVSLVFTDKPEIQKLNKEFRNKDMPTDVLSFNLNEPDHLGEIVICPKVVEEQAEEYGVTFEAEMMKMYVHGVLHLLGYDHERSAKDEKIMNEKQEYYLSLITK